VAEEKLLTSAGMASPCRKCWNKTSACAGRCWGTACPAPQTVTKVRPSYYMLQPPTYQHSMVEIVRNSAGFREEHVGGYYPVLETLTSVGTMYQGYQLVLTGRPRAARERLVDVRGTTVSVSPLQNGKKNMDVFSCTRKSLKKAMYTRCLYTSKAYHLEASSDELLVDG